MAAAGDEGGAAATPGRRQKHLNLIPCGRKILALLLLAASSCQLLPTTAATAAANLHEYRYDGEVNIGNKSLTFIHEYVLLSSVSATCMCS